MRRRMRLRTTAFPRSFFTLMPKRLGRVTGGTGPCCGSGDAWVPPSLFELTAVTRLAANAGCKRKKTAN
jgi:hypothetical protein